MPDLAYCQPSDVIALAGDLALDLRNDDVDFDTQMIAAISWASGRIDYYCAKYGEDVLAVNRWVNGVTTFLAVYWHCIHRLNDVPKSIQKMWDDEYKPELQAIQKGTADVPRAVTSRRPVAVSNYNVDLRRANNQVRTDRTRSTGVSQGYVRPTDNTAPDDR